MHLIPISGFPVIWHNAVGSGALAAEVLRLICDFWINTLGADCCHRAVSIGAIYVPEGHDTDPCAITKTLKTCITADAAVFGADGGILPFQIRIIHLPVAKTAVGAVGKQIGFKIDHILRITGVTGNGEPARNIGSAMCALILVGVDLVGSGHCEHTAPVPAIGAILVLLNRCSRFTGFDRRFRGGEISAAAGAFLKAGGIHI